MGRAEMAATPAEKAEFLESGMTKSIEPTEGEVTTYIDGVVADFLAASGDAQMNILSEQYWIALYGGGVEAFNYYRRTGFPTTLAPNWEANPGAFPRSFLYPQTEVITNSNV